jgi:two-component system, LytTR family, response regulator LytT
MQVLIIEDEPLAAERIKILLQQFDASIAVMAIMESIEQTVLWLRTKPHPDLIISDIELSDGHCFEIFKQAAYKGPMIFTTAYGEFALHAYEYNTISYILKPVTLEALAAAINKLKTFPVLPAYTGTMQNGFLPEEYKTRFLAKVGQRLFFVDCADIACFYTENKILYILDKSNNKYIINNSLEKIEEQLNPKMFFRPNRKIIVNYTAIEQIKPYYNNRLKLLLKVSVPGEEILISREKVPFFKEWAEN